MERNEKEVTRDGFILKMNECMDINYKQELFDIFDEGFILLKDIEKYCNDTDKPKSCDKITVMTDWIEKQKEYVLECLPTFIREKMEKCLKNYGTLDLSEEDFNFEVLSCKKEWRNIVKRFVTYAFRDLLNYHCEHNKLIY